MKFSRKLLGKRVRRHINIKSVTLNVQSVRQPWTRMLAVAYEKFWTALATGFWGRPFQMISSLVRRSSIADGLLSSSFCLRDCKIVMLTTYVTNLISKLVINATSLMPWFYLSTEWRSSSPRMQRKTGYTPLQWLYREAWMATKLARS